MNEDLKWLAENVHEWKDDYLYLGRQPQNSVGWFSEECSIPHRVEFWCTQPQWQAARDELSGKPGWELAEDDEEWVAQDEDGRWYFYKTKPKIKIAVFDSDDGASVDEWEGRVLGDWRNTLERRPEAAGTEATAQIRTATDCSLRQFAISKIISNAERTILDDDVREVFINLVSELNDEALAGVAGRVVK